MTTGISASNFSSLAVFLFGALCLIAPSGYSWGAALLTLGGLIILVRKKHWPDFSKKDYYVMASLALFAGVWLLEVLIDGQGISRAERPLKFFAALTAAFYLFKYPPKAEWFWSGIALGAIGAGSWALWQTIVMGAVRAGGHTHLIQHGNISLLWGVICLAGIGWATAQKHPTLWISLLMAGFGLGLTGSGLSGSRGGWVAIPLVFPLFLYAYYTQKNGKLIMTAVLLFTIILSSLYLIPQTRIKTRVLKSITEVTKYYTENNATSSVGVRLEMWRASIYLIKQKPYFGWGRKGYEKERDNLADNKVFHPAIKNYTSVHNEIIDTALKRGIIGLFTLLFMYLLPFIYFMKKMLNSSIQIKSLALAGALVPLCFTAFGLTQVFFSHNSGVMVYSFMTIMIWSMVRLQLKQTIKEQ